LGQEKLEIDLLSAGDQSHGKIGLTHGGNSVLSDTEIASAILRNETGKAHRKAAQRTQLVLGVRKQVLGGRSIKDACAAMGVERMTFYRILTDNGLTTQMLFDGVLRPREDVAKACPYCAAPALIREAKGRAHYCCQSCGARIHILWKGRGY